MQTCSQVKQKTPEEGNHIPRIPAYKRRPKNQINSNRRSVNSNRGKMWTVSPFITLFHQLLLLCMWSTSSPLWEANTHNLQQKPMLQQQHSLTRPCPTEGPCYQEPPNSAIQCAPLLQATKQQWLQVLMIPYKGKSIKWSALPQRKNSVLSMQKNASSVFQRGRTKKIS